VPVITSEVLGIIFTDVVRIFLSTYISSLKIICSLVSSETFAATKLVGVRRILTRETRRELFERRPVPVQLVNRCRAAGDRRLRPLTSSLHATWLPHSELIDCFVHPPLACVARACRPRCLLAAYTTVHTPSPLLRDSNQLFCRQKLFCHSVVRLLYPRRFLWPPYVIGGHYIFALWFLSSIYLLSSFFSSPNLSGHRLDLYHTSTHGVALVRI